MGKGWLIIIGIIVVLGLFLYYKPEKTTENFKNLGSIIKDKFSDFLENRYVNLGKPSLPCSDDSDCNENIERCSNRCKCIEGECHRNVPVNST